MTEMKKIYFALIAFAAIFMTVDANAQLTVGAGYNHEVMTERAGGDDESEGLDGFYIEATYDWDFLEDYWGLLAIQPGLRFSYMGNSESEELMGVKMRSSLNETYFDIPVHVKYSYPLGDLKLSAFAGPVFSLGLSSSAKFTMKGDGEDYMTKVSLYTGKTVSKGDDGGYDAELDGSATDYARFDLKLGVGVGASIADVISVKAGYNFGLLNRYTGEYDYKIHTGVFYVGLGFSF